MLSTISLYPTNLIEYTNPLAEHLNVEIERYLKKEREDSPNLPSFSSRGNTAWHSFDNLTDLTEDWSVALRQMIYDVSDRYHMGLQQGRQLPSFEQVRIKCWALILGQHDYSNYHTHPNSDISGVYWVKNPPVLPENEGRFAVPDPRGGAQASRLQGSAMFYHPPVEGTGLVFPSWLPHFVEPHYQEGERISISWNLFIKDPPEGTVNIASSAWRDNNGDNWG